MDRRHSSAEESSEAVRAKPSPLSLAFLRSQAAEEQDQQVQKVLEDSAVEFFLAACRREGGGGEVSERLARQRVRAASGDAQQAVAEWRQLLRQQQRVQLSSSALDCIDLT